MSETPIRIGIAGLGRSGWDIHAHLLSGLTDKYHIVAVADADAARRQEAAARFGCRTHEDFAGLLRDDAVEAVIVALPSHLHADLSIAALDAGKHVVCEKPMALSLADADRMIAAAQRSGRILTIFHNRRYDPHFRQVQAVIAPGVLGRIVQIRLHAGSFSRRWDWQTLKQYGGGTLNNTGPHFLDQALLLFGEGQPQVFCHLERTLTLGDADDHVKIILSGPGAPTVDIEISSACAYPQDWWHIMGTQGGLRGTPKRLEWKYSDPATWPPRTLDTRPTPDRSYNRDALAWQEACWEAGQDDGPGHAGFYLDLYDTLRHGKPLAVTPQSVRRGIWLQDECHRLSPV